MRTDRMFANSALKRDTELALKDVFWLLLLERRTDKPLAEGRPSGFLGTSPRGARTPPHHVSYVIFIFVSGGLPSALLKIGHNWRSLRDASWLETPASALTTGCGTRRAFL